MNKLKKRAGLLVLLAGCCSLGSTLASAAGMVWGESNWGETNWGVEQVRESVPPPEGPVPTSTKVRDISGAETDAGFSAGAYADNGTPVYGNAFSAGDYITMIGEVYPDSGDVGKNGDIIVVMLSIINNSTVCSYQNEDGNFVSWNLKVPSLGTAKRLEPLEDMNAITIFEGTLQAGAHRLALGYMADGGSLIFTSKAINIMVSE